MIIKKKKRKKSPEVSNSTYIEQPKTKSTLKRKNGLVKTPTELWLV